MAERCNDNILKALALARQLIILADEGETHAKDDSCAVLYGVIRDCAYKIRHQAERERQAHMARATREEDDFARDGPRPSRDSAVERK